MNQNGDAQIDQILLRAGRCLKLSAVLVGVSYWLVTCLGLWLVLFLLDNLFSLPAGLRLPLALGGAALAGIGFFRRIYSAAAVRQRLERTAIMLEKRYGIPENLLINAWQFGRRNLRAEERPFAQHIISHGQQVAAEIRFADLWDRRELMRWGSGAAVLLFLWFGYIVVFPRYVLNAGSRFVLPLSDRPPAAALALNVTPSSDVAIVEGENLEVSAYVNSRPNEKISPMLIWKEGIGSVEPLKTAGDPVPMASGTNAGQSSYVFTDVRRPFAFRIFAQDAYSRSIQVQVRPLPRLKESLFRVTPPAYTGLGPIANPGPPSSVSALAGSKLEVVLAIEPSVQNGVWKENAKSVPLTPEGKRWQATTMVTNAGEYEIQVTDQQLKKQVTVARGAVRLEMDNPPEIDFVTDDRNRLVNLSSTVKLELTAKDDYGIQKIEITARPLDQDSSQPSKVLKRWTYMGPPGNKGPLKETYALLVDPANFAPDATYLIEALALDFRPDGQPGKSRPIMLRVKSLNDYTIPSDDPLGPAFEALRQTIAKQEKANGRTSNLKTYLEEAMQQKTLPDRQKEMRARQDEAKTAGAKTANEFKKVSDAKAYAVRMSSLVEGEMAWVMTDIPKLDLKKPAAIPPRLDEIEKRQTYILTELIAMLGKIADQKQSPSKTNQTPRELDTAPLVTSQEMAGDLKDDLKKFMGEQERILDRSKMLMDKGPEDLSEKEEKILGELAREEAQWAKFFEEKLTDFSKLPQQDFADASLAKELNSVFQEVKAAAGDLYAKKTELAVPLEQSGLENAKTLENNLERWLPDKPDTTKWNMEEATEQTDIALAELPAELEDIVGDLIDKEEEMTQDVEDVSSPWLDSLDKGAGWDAMDGPISSMSAKGVTGNQLPNNMEIGGRSGEGRSGKSSGQMVSDTAEGKGGRETPTRLSATPFEQGSVKDSDKSSKGGATGGGKLSGTGAEGLRGPAAPQTNQKLPRLADQQAKIRQEAESLALKLRRYHLPTGDLEESINSMKRFETSAKKGDGLGVRRSFSRAVDALDDAKKTLRLETGLHRERTKLPEWMRDEIRVGVQDGVPKGYEEMIGEYFKAMAESKKK